VTPDPYLWALQGAALLLACIGLLLVLRWLKAPLWGLAPAAAAVALPGWRAVQTGHLPLASLHETLLTFGACLVLVSAPACARYRLPRVFGLCLGGAGALWLFSSALPARPTPLVPALQTLWFEVHVLTSFVAYACFALAAAAGTVHLLSSGGAERRVVRGANLWGFACFTWAMVSGGIWAYLAWGTYWLWHVKELWSALVWTFYAGLIHLPHLPRWKGRVQSALSLVGFGLVLFTYLGVGLFMRNTHQF
jgi:ABC-type transport system involved in cytochrome c biogenesis permease subunit